MRSAICSAIYSQASDPTDALKKARHYTLFSAELQNNSVLKAQSYADLSRCQRF